jgi:hypothetical protein
LNQFEAEVGAAALFFLPFVALFGILCAASPPTPSQLLAADPLIRLVTAHAGLWAVAALSAVPAIAWLLFAAPSRASLRAGSRGCAAAIVAAAVGLPLLRWVVGPALPSFVPPEESSAPGMALGVGAGMLEEAVFRLGLLAVGFLFARRHCSPVRAEALAVLVTSLAFALSHELGPGSPGFDPRIFATRFIVPGCLMSSLFFRPGPSFLVTLHCSLHVGIALLFPGRSLAA